jgi:lipopolysaccharide/colanic/teichoic acid biosynthesis glycosyltransferase
MKRSLDICFSILLLIILFPFLVLVGLFIAAIDGFPILFIQERIGLNKSRFYLYKFRTMNPDGVTPLGRFIRATGLDELPQLFNVLKGDMSFIGPRPLTEFDIVRLGWDSPEYDIRWSVPPGITGLAQFAPVCDKSLSCALDFHYISNRNLALDLKILLGSFAVIFLGKNSVKRLMRTQ